jgi:MYXO-CTERM domain-containing protein
MLEETTVRFVKNGVPLDAIAVTTDPFDAELAVVAPATGEDRYRAEVLIKDKPRTIASHVFVSLDPSGPDAVSARANAGTDAGGGCGVSATGASNAWVVVVGAAIVALRRLRRRRQ